MAKIDLTSPRLKLTRAWELLGAFEGEYQAFYAEGQDIHISTTREADTKSVEWNIVRFERILRDFPTRWGLLIG